MSWRTPVALEGAHDIAFNVYIVNTVLVHLAWIPYAILTYFRPKLIDILVYFELALLLFVLAPLVLYHIAVIFYHLWKFGGSLCFRTTYLCRRLHHTAALWYLRRTAFARSTFRKCRHGVQELARNGIFFVVYRLPPFNHASRRWTRPPSRQSWVSRPGCGTLATNTCVTSNVCENCHGLIRSSPLLLGSPWPLTRRREEHRLGLTLAALETSASSKPCHFCTVLWSSMSDHDQAQAKNLEATPLVCRNSATNPSEDIERLPLLRLGGPALRLVIWKQSKENAHDQAHLYMQLALDSVLLGDRILVEEDQNPSGERELSRSTDSASCIDMAQDWLKDCKSNHPKCRSREASRSFIPSRLIQVESVNDSNVRAHLVQTQGWSNKVDYLALSHCWGSSVDLTLTDHNNSSLCQEIDTTKLSRNFIDAIHCTQKLGFSYLWIDSLCIMQKCFDHDSASTCNRNSLRDWEAESREMASVYAQAYCTISATGSAESSGGCFKQRNPLPHFPCHLLTEPSGHRSLTVKAANTSFKTNMFLTEVDSGPLNTRAWAFQERLLSQRVIHFGASLMFFECSTLLASELQPEGIYNGVDVLTRDGTRHEFPDLDRWNEMLTPFLPPPTPSSPTLVEPEEFSPPNHPSPARPSSSLKLPKFTTSLPSKHERQKRAHYRRAWDTFQARQRRRDEEYAADERRHAARERARLEHAERERLRASERAAQAPPAPNPAYKPPEVVASISDNSVTGYRGAFDFLAAAAASSHRIEPRDQLRLHQRWFELVGKYTRSHLTVASDRHMAAAGVAKAIQGSGAGTDYLAGLWRRHLELDLLWSLEGLPKARPSEYRAPSWSWIAVDGEVSQRLLPFTLANEARMCDLEMMATVVGVRVLDKQSGKGILDATAPIGGGWLDLRGVLWPVLQMDVESITRRGQVIFSNSRAECILDALPSEAETSAPCELFCLPILSMRRLALSSGESRKEIAKPSVHGIILTASITTIDSKHKASGKASYQRFGTFVLWEEEGRGPLEVIVAELEGKTTNDIITVT